jgi:hypothetical protein
VSNLSKVSNVADSIDQVERAMFADIVIRIAKGNLSAQELGMGHDLYYLRAVSIDWNAALRKGNRYYDRFAAAARISNYQARTAVMSQLEAELQSMARNIGPHTVVSSVLSRSARSDAVGNIMISMLLPALNAASEAQDRQNCSLELLRVAAALAVYRAEHGNYPDTLVDLPASVIAAPSLDLFNGPILYKRTADGYLLYSAGPNRMDDGGSNERMQIFEGHPFDQLDETAKSKATIRSGADDISIRVHSPPLLFPKPRAAKSGE